MQRITLPSFDAPWLPGVEPGAEDDLFLDSPRFAEMCAALLPQDAPGVDNGASAGGSSLAAEPRLIGSAALYRCLDTSHPDGCARCIPPPLAGEDGDFELCNDDTGSGASSLVSRLTLLARMPASSNADAHHAPSRREAVAQPPLAYPGGALTLLFSQSTDTSFLQWASVDARESAAATCAAGSRLAAALRARRASDLRKADFLCLARTWGYRANLWRRRKCRAPADAAQNAYAGGITEPRAAPHPDAAPARTQPPSSLDLFANQPSETVLAACHSVISNQLRLLAERSVTSFRANAEHKTSVTSALRTMVASLNGQPLPRRLARSIIAHLDFQLKGLTEAEATLCGLVGGARDAHATLQGRMLSVPHERGTQPAFQVVGCGSQPWDGVFAVMADLADFAVASKKSPTSLPALVEEDEAPSDAVPVSSESGDSASSTPLFAAWVELASSRNGAAAVEEGGRTAGELVTRLTAVLAPLKLVPYNTFAACVSLALGLVIGHLTATHEAVRDALRAIQDSRALVA